ncbi:PcfJ domain-containing protein [Desulforamulus ruminis]|uniref:PcfJ-like protein n=1 Tax=Desulforamulus ruminis (strain ATCC 23193 / DSM 2154 / NCIMB 8452 / DL) TaxID=696281 RepID=F6DM14_DESRL|nr:PcfJ domain-containing protein [Desulforamulus ruminis]AEG59356.1 hypothetical protein Desru_1081 [Desulforamulus ruminis DSM 2154]
MLAATVVIPQMFTAYAEDLGYHSNGLHHFQYFCEQCDQAFTVTWGKKTGAMGWYERGDYFHCPHCGMRHEKHVVTVKRGVQAPNEVRLSVKVYKSAVTFEVYSSTVYFQDTLRVFSGKHKEIFRFDLAKQKVVFTRYKNNCKIESFEIGNPYELEVLEKSILGFFLPNSLANTREKAELYGILRVLRETVQAKLERHLGHKISSMYVSPGQYYGAFLLPIFNMAYRVLFPDAPNLPNIYRESPGTIRSYWKMKMVNGHFMEAVIASTRERVDFVSALAAANAVPDRPLMRRILAVNPFEIGLLAQSFALCRNYDLAVRLYAGFKLLKANGNTLEYAVQYVNEDLIEFLREMLPLYGEAGVVRMVEEAREINLRDCIRLHQQLNEENRERLKTEKVRLKELHDWMARTHRRQNHVNLKFEVPDHIIKRLSMQKDKIKFFMPKESLELLEAGAELHNCVASYGKAMKDNTQWIVLVADDKGKLAACLEIRGKALVQAKLDKNIPVARDAKLNNEVLAWAKNAGLEIKTEDVEAQEEMILKTG